MAASISVFGERGRDCYHLGVNVSLASSCSLPSLQATLWQLILGSLVTDLFREALRPFFIVTAVVPQFSLFPYLLRRAETAAFLLFKQCCFLAARDFIKYFKCLNNIQTKLFFRNSLPVNGSQKSL